jgi:hypothetical protein
MMVGDKSGISVTLDDEMLRYIRKYSKETGQSASSTIRMIISKFMEMEDANSKTNLIFLIKEDKIKLKKLEDKLQEKIEMLNRIVNEEKNQELETKEREEKELKEVNNVKREKEEDIFNIIKTLNGIEPLNQYLDRVGKDFEESQIIKFLDDLFENNSDKVRYIDEFNLIMYANRYINKSKLTDFVKDKWSMLGKKREIDTETKLISLDGYDDMLKAIRDHKEEKNLLNKEEYGKMKRYLEKKNQNIEINYDFLKDFMDKVYKDHKIRSDSDGKERRD